MTVLNADYYEQFGFLALERESEVELTYGIVEAMVSQLQLPSRHSVLFSIVQYGKEIKQIVTPALLNMPSDPPFLITLSSKADIINLFDEHRRSADGLDFAHSRIAQYLTLWHLARAAGADIDPEIVAYLTRSELDWDQKLYTVVDPQGEGARLTSAVRKVGADPKRRAKSDRGTISWRVEQ